MNLTDFTALSFNRQKPLTSVSLVAVTTNMVDCII